MENTIETSTFDVLMEGTMYGAQIDSVLMEAEEAGKKDLTKSALSAYIQALLAAGKKVNATGAQKIEAKYQKAIAANNKKYATVDAGAKGVEKELSKDVNAFALAVSEYASLKPSGDAKNEDVQKQVADLKLAVKDAKKELTMMQRAMAYIKKALGQIAKVGRTVVGLDNPVNNWKQIAATVGMIIGGYAVAYGILKTISGVAVNSFLAVKSNIALMYKVAKDPKTYGAKSFIFGLLLSTVLVGFARLAVTIGKVMKLLFDKGGKAIKNFKEKRAAK